MHDTICAALTEGSMTVGDLFWETDPEELEWEACSVPHTEKRDHGRYTPGDQTNLLTEFERNNVTEYIKLRLERLGKSEDKELSEEDLRNWAVAVTQNPNFHPVQTSSATGRMPTYTASSPGRFLWYHALKRWQTAREKFAAHAWPVTKELAAAMGVPMVDLRAWGIDPGHLHHLIGNSMHLACLAAAYLTQLVCVELYEHRGLAPLQTVHSLMINPQEDFDQLWRQRIQVPQDRCTCAAPCISISIYIYIYRYTYR